MDAGAWGDAPKTIPNNYSTARCIDHGTLPNVSVWQYLRDSGHHGK